jgi:hypothetical protein
MKRTFLIILLVHFGIICYAQIFKISGKVFDAQNNPVEFANIVLLSTSDSSFIAGTATDSLGNFELQVECGKYELRVLFVGYNPYKKQIDIINDIFLDNIILSNSIMLDEVIVTATRPRMKVNSAGIEVNVENSMLAKGNTMESLLMQMPSVWIGLDGNTIQASLLAVFQ